MLLTIGFEECIGTNGNDFCSQGDIGKNLLEADIISFSMSSLSPFYQV